MNLETEQRHLQDAPHCLLLWRKPPPDLGPAAAFLSILRICRIFDYSYTGITTMKVAPFPNVDSTHTRP